MIIDISFGRRRLRLFTQSLTYEYIKKKTFRNKKLSILTVKGSFNPYLLMKWKIQHRWRKFLIKKYPWLQCECCGEGLRRWYIKDPNHSVTDKRRRLECCDLCVNFYDIHCTQKPIHNKVKQND